MTVVFISHNIDARHWNLTHKMIYLRFNKEILEWYCYDTTIREE